MTERKRTIDSLASQAYGRGMLKTSSIGEWFWIQEAGGRVYLGWSLSGAERRLRIVVDRQDRRSISGRV